MKSLSTYSGRTLIFAALVLGIVFFAFFVFVTVVFDLWERQYVVVRASDYVRMNRTDFANAVDALPRLDSVSPDEQKKINDTVNTLKKLHLSLNPLEDLFEGEGFIDLVGVFGIFLIIRLLIPISYLMLKSVKGE